MTTGGPTRRLEAASLRLADFSRDRTIAEGLEQTAVYMDRCAAREGHLVVIDRAPGKSWDDKVLHRRATSRGAAGDVWGM